MDNIVIIADDLTGAADSAVQFGPYFDDTILVSDQKWDRILELTLPASTRATAIYTNSRALGVEPARKRLDSLAQKLGKIEGLRIFKKIDSCMRGNVGAETDALLDQLGYAASFIVPAFPEMGRTTLEDTHRIHGIPLDQTEISQDPVTPVTESSLTRIVALQSRYPVGHVGLAVLENGNHALLAEIERQMQSGVRHIVFDATNRVHLDRIARVWFSFERQILPVGSAGLAGSLATLLTLKPTSAEPAKIIAPGGFNLLVCGTTSTVTAQQIDKLAENYSYEVMGLSPDMLANPDCKEEFAETASAARSCLAKKNMILTIQPQKNSRGEPGQTHFQPAADSVAGGLGGFVAEVVAKVKPGHLFMTGGDTADAVLRTFETKGIRILGEIVAGVVHGVIMGGLQDGLAVVTKAGAFGKKDTLVAVHEFWQVK